MRGYEDWDFWLGALEHGWQGRQVRVVTFYYRRHGTSMISGARLAYRHWYRRPAPRTLRCTTAGPSSPASRT